MKVWNTLASSGGDFTFQPGGRYAVLASVSKNYSLEEVEKYVEGKGFQVTYAWEQGQPTRATYPIDDWLAGLAPDTTDNHRWLYAEGDYNGVDPWTVGQDPPWPLSIYHVSNVLVAVDAPAPTSPSDTPVAPSIPTSTSSVPASSGLSPMGAAVAIFSVAVLAGVAWIHFRSPVLAMAEAL